MRTGLAENKPPETFTGKRKNCAFWSPYPTLSKPFILNLAEWLELGPLAMMLIVVSQYS